MNKDVLFGALSYISLTSIIYINFICNFDGCALSEEERMQILYFIPMILIFFVIAIRVNLMMKFKDLMKQKLTEGERDIDLKDTDTMAWITMSLSAFFVLIAAFSTLEELKINAKPIIWYVLISFVAFYISHSLKSYKFDRFIQQVGDILETTARLSFLSAIIITAWQGDIGTIYLLIITSLTFLSWGVDFFTRLNIWKKYFNTCVSINSGR